MIDLRTLRPVVFALLGAVLPLIALTLGVGGSLWATLGEVVLLGWTGHAMGEGMERRRYNVTVPEHMARPEPETNGALAACWVMAFMFATTHWWVNISW